MTISIMHGLSERFAEVSYTDSKGRNWCRNICDVCDGKTNASKDVVRFAMGWLGLK